MLFVLGFFFLLVFCFMLFFHMRWEYLKILLYFWFILFSPESLCSERKSIHESDLAGHYTIHSPLPTCPQAVNPSLWDFTQCCYLSEAFQGHDCAPGTFPLLKLLEYWWPIPHNSASHGSVQNSGILVSRGRDGEDHAVQTVGTREFLFHFT